MKRFILACLTVFFVPVASAQILDKSSSLALEQDALSNTWNIDCSAEVSGIDRSFPHRIDVHLQQTGEPIGTLTLFNSHVEILPDENRISQIVDGVDFEIKKAGDRLIATIYVSDYYPFGTHSGIYCSIGFSRIVGPAEYRTLYAVQMTQGIVDSGTP